MDEQYPLSLKVLETDLGSLDAGKPERRERGRERKASADIARVGHVDSAAPPLEGLDAKEQPPLLPQDLKEEPAERQDREQESSEECPHHDRHTQTPPPEVQAIRAS